MRWSIFCAPLFGRRLRRAKGTLDDYSLFVVVGGRDVELENRAFLAEMHQRNNLGTTALGDLLLSEHDLSMKKLRYAEPRWGRVLRIEVTEARSVPDAPYTPLEGKEGIEDPHMSTFVARVSARRELPPETSEHKELLFADADVQAVKSDTAMNGRSARRHAWFSAGKC